MMRFRLARIALLIAATSAVPISTIAGPLDPTQFTSLGTLSLTTAGTYLISGDSLIVGSTTYTGVYYNGIAVFDFTSINIASGVNLSSEGIPSNTPVAFLSQTSATIAGTINVSAVGSQGGPGATTSGAGGAGTSGSIPGQPNPPPQSIYWTGGGGGGFGGSGGQGGGPSFVSVGAGGGPYASLANILQGGSSGGVSGFAKTFGNSASTVGGGGGAVEIGAVGSLSISGTILANGGSSDAFGSGGGSGGGIFLHADSVSLTGGLDAGGGSGSAGTGTFGFYSGGGGGGGGSILVDSGSGGFSNAGGSIYVGGGYGGGGYISGQNGGSGTFITAALVPEPSSLVMLGTSICVLIGVATVRRRCHHKDNSRNRMTNATTC